MSWNVGAVYLVAGIFQALILVCAIYTLVFLKSVSLTSDYIRFLNCLAFRRREWKNPEPNVVTTSFTQFGRF